MINLPVPYIFRVRNSLNERKPMLDEAGYTLIEMLIVLLILSSVTAITVVSFQSLHEASEVDDFFEQLEKDLYTGQQYALTHREQVDVLFNRQGYTIKERSGRVLADRSFPTDTYVTPGPNFDLAFHYKSNGHINKFGKLFFTVGKERYKLTFQIGKGRFAIEKR